MKQKGRGRLARRYLPALAVFLFTSAVLTLMAAYLMKNGYISVSWGSASRLTTVGIAALVAGRLTDGTGKQGALAGVALALICAIWTACTNPNTFFTIDRVIELALCILCSWLGSCIFHKKKARYTKRNRR